MIILKSPVLWEVTILKYDEFLAFVKYRRSIRRFKPDPIPDDYVMKILDAAHYAMSGANSQPWEFLVVKDPEIKEKLFKVASEVQFEISWPLEQQRIPKYRHPSFNVADEEKDKTKGMSYNWKDAPVFICVLADPRKQFGSALSARSDFCSHSHSVFATTMGHLSMMIHLAAASLQLGSQRVDILIQEPYRQILKYPEPINLETIVPVGYRMYEPGPAHRLPLEDLVHFEQYDMSKYMCGEGFLKYLDKIRELSRSGYRVAIGEEKG